MGTHIESLTSTPVASEAPYYVRGLALGVMAFLIGIHLWTWVFMLPTFLGGRADFRQLYTAGYMVRTGHARELYNYDSQLRFQNEIVSRADIPLPFIRPAYQALLFAPFSWLRYRTAYLVFLAANLVLLGISFRLLRPFMDRLAEIYRWLPAAMFLGYLPIAAALMQGQDSILLLTLLLAAAVSLGRGRDLTAGLLAGLGLFKFQIVLPIALSS
jgi:Glycosyltransferase family 87